MFVCELASRSFSVPVALTPAYCCARCAYNNTYITPSLAVYFCMAKVSLVCPTPLCPPPLPLLSTTTNSPRSTSCSIARRAPTAHSTATRRARENRSPRVGAGGRADGRGPTAKEMGQILCIVNWKKLTRAQSFRVQIDFCSNPPRNGYYFIWKKIENISFYIIFKRPAVDVHVYIAL